MISRGWRHLQPFDATLHLSRATFSYSTAKLAARRGPSMIQPSWINPRFAKINPPTRSLALSQSHRQIYFAFPCLLDEWNRPIRALIVPRSEPLRANFPPRFGKGKTRLVQIYPRANFAPVQITEEYSRGWILTRQLHLVRFYLPSESRRLSSSAEDIVDDLDERERERERERTVDNDRGGIKRSVTRRRGRKKAASRPRPLIALGAYVTRHFHR